MFIDTGDNNLYKLRRSGMFMSPLTGLWVEENVGTINIKPLRGFCIEPLWGARTVFNGLLSTVYSSFRHCSLLIRREPI